MEKTYETTEKKDLFKDEDYIKETVSNTWEKDITLSTKESDLLEAKARVVELEQEISSIKALSKVPK